MSTTEYDPIEGVGPLVPNRIGRSPERPLRSLLAAAQRVKSKRVSRVGQSTKAEAWQTDAWDMYDLVGEHRFLATTLANRLSQARLFVGLLPDNPTEDIVPLEEGAAYDVFSTLEQSGANLDQIINRLGVNLFVAGDGWLVGVPRILTAEPELTAMDLIPAFAPFDPASIDITELDWHMMSVSEVSLSASGEVTLKGRGDRAYRADELWLIRVWRPHPRFWEQADAPTRSSLPVLRELVGLTMHIGAQIDSRLAGAGVFLIPESADRAVRAAAGIPEDGDDAPSPFIEALMEAMVTPVSDRGSASALVPVMPVVPDDSIEKFRYISFSTPLDAEARSLRDEAIRRLALGMDCPPELLLGVSSMNHWGAWLVREEVVTTHLEPPLALICDAWTTQFLWPVLEEQGMKEAEVRRHVVWYDVDHLIMRPDRSQDAKDLHGSGVISDEALRNSTGFDESDAPARSPIPEDPAVTAALDLVKAAPTLAADPGLLVLVEQIRGLYAGTASTEDATAIADALAEPQDAPEEPVAAQGGPPTQEDGTGPETAAEPPSLAASGPPLPRGVGLHSVSGTSWAT